MGVLVRELVAKLVSLIPLRLNFATTFGRQDVLKILDDTFGYGRSIPLVVNVEHKGIRITGRVRCGVMHAEFTMKLKKEKSLRDGRK